ncbi:MAG: site-specific integrase [Clostridiales bacterium]|nr:site-specific integrase [Clostridiales bacterium]
MIKRKDGLWQQAVTVTVRGRKTRKYFYGHTKAEVNRKIAAWKEEQERGRAFDVVCAEWQKEHFPHIAEGTKVCYRPAIERAVSFFGAQPVREIVPLDIQRALGLMARQGYAHQSVKIYLSVINQVLNYAVLMGDIDANPAAVVQVPKGLERNRRDAPTEEELETIRNSLHTARFGLFAYLLLNTGLRRGEALALQWRDVDFKACIIRVQKSVYYTDNQPHIKEPKTSSGIRSVILTDSLYTALYPLRGPQDDICLAARSRCHSAVFGRCGGNTARTPGCTSMQSRTARQRKFPRSRPTSCAMPMQRCCLRRGSPSRMHSPCWATAKRR